jgi:hypothetical protein
VPNNKQIYIGLCEKENIPLYSQYWWLDAVAGEDNWDVLISEEDGHPLAAMPFVKKRLGPLKLIKMPELTPWLSIWFNVAPNAKYNTRLSFEKKHLGDLISRLPKVHRFHQKYSYDFQNWLPFFWQGFKQTTRYSYVIDETVDEQSAFQQFKKNTRYDIKKAQKEVTVIESDEISKFLALNKKSFERQTQKPSYSDELVLRLDNVCRARECRKILCAVDAQERVHAAVYLVWDNRSVYYIMGGGDSSLRQSKANSLLIWEAIKFALSSGKRFDFEGSMIEPIEKFFRSFGAQQRPYFSISKNKFPINMIELVR